MWPNIYISLHVYFPRRFNIGYSYNFRQTTNGSGHCRSKKKRLDTSIIAEENEAVFLDKYIG